MKKMKRVLIVILAVIVIYGVFLATNDRARENFQRGYEEKQAELELERASEQ